VLRQRHGRRHRKHGGKQQRRRKVNETSDHGPYSAGRSPPPRSLKINTRLHYDESTACRPPHCTTIAARCMYFCYFSGPGYFPVMVRASAISASASMLLPFISAAQASIPGSATLRQRATSAASSVTIALPRRLAASSPGASPSFMALPAQREVSSPELSSITFLRSGGRPSYLALFIAKMKNVV